MKRQVADISLKADLNSNISKDLPVLLTVNFSLCSRVSFPRIHESIRGIEIEEPVEFVNVSLKPWPFSSELRLICTSAVSLSFLNVTGLTIRLDPPREVEVVKVSDMLLSKPVITTLYDALQIQGSLNSPVWGEKFLTFFKDFHPGRRSLSSSPIKASHCAYTTDVESGIACSTNIILIKCEYMDFV